jgi:amino acid permease
MQVVFLVIASDILIGEPPDHFGLIRQLTGLGSGLATSKPAVLGALCALVLLPLGSMKNMDRLAAVNVIGVASNALFAALTLALAAGAAARGVAAAPPLWPEWDGLVAKSGGRVAAGLALASTLPVILNCFSCHQSLHPLLPCLRPYTTKRAQAMVASSLTIAGILVYTVAL